MHQVELPQQYGLRLPDIGQRNAVQPFLAIRGIGKGRAVFVPGGG
jgi:hypothetical protein